MPSNMIQPRFLQSETELIRVLDGDSYVADFLWPNTSSSLSPESSRWQLDEWLTQLKADRDALSGLLCDNGGVLLRNLPVTSAADFEAVAGCFLPVQESYIGGVSRRSKIHNNVYNTTEAPQDVVIEQHLEATHTPRPPTTIVFNCQTAPAERGETPLASFVALFEALPRKITDALEGERVVYTRELMDRRSYLYGLLPASVTSSLALSWQEVSGCDDFDEAREALEAEGYEVTVRGKRRLRTRCSQPVISTHPKTGARRWYLSDQITRKLPWYTRGPRRLLRSQLGMEFALESGRAFAPGVLELVHETLDSLRFSFAWRPGDVLVLDNEQMSHGRNTFAGDRLILTAFG